MFKSSQSSAARKKRVPNLDLGKENGEEVADLRFENQSVEQRLSTALQSSQEAVGSRDKPMMAFGQRIMPHLLSVASVKETTKATSTNSDAKYSTGKRKRPKRVCTENSAKQSGATKNGFQTAEKKMPVSIGVQGDQTANMEGSTEKVKQGEQTGQIKAT